MNLDDPPEVVFAAVVAGLYEAFMEGGPGTYRIVSEVAEGALAGLLVGAAEEAMDMVQRNRQDPGRAPPGPGRRRRGGGGRGAGAAAPELTGFSEAVRLLEDVADRRPIEVLSVGDMRGSARVEEAPSFLRFVTLLGQREGGRAVQHIDFLVDWTLLPPEDVARLFRDVLPAHPTLASMAIDISNLPSRFLKLLTEALPTEVGESTLSSLAFTCPDTFPTNDSMAFAENLQAIVEMLNRNAALEDLAMVFRLNQHQCKRVCQALGGNRNLTLLSLEVTEIYADTLDGLATLSLRLLLITAPFSHDALLSLATQLRTNEALQGLSLTDVAGNDRRSSQALLELVKTYNYTLRTIGGNLGSGHDDARVRERFEQYMRRNKRVRVAFGELQDPDPALRFRVPTPLLPSVLGLVRDLPTALYRILRMGYGNAVSDLVLAASPGTASAAATTTTTTTTAQVTPSTTTITATTVEASEARRRSSRLAKRRRI